MTRYTPQWLQQGTYAASVDRRLLSFLPSGGAVNGGLVTVATGMNVNIAAGQALVPTNNNTGSVLCSWDAVEQVALAAAGAAGQHRYDLVVVQARGNDLDGGANNDFLITNVTGTASGTPSVPAVPANAVALSQHYIPGASSQVTLGNTVDRRYVLSRSGLLASINRTTAAGPAGPAATPVSGLAITAYVPANRLILVETFITAMTTSVSQAFGYIQVTMDGSSVAQGNVYAPGTGLGPCYCMAVTTPAAGVHTWQVLIGVNTGTVTTVAAPGYPSVLMLTDKGPAS